MGSMSRLETMRKVIAMILIIVICFTLIDASAFAVSQGINVQFGPIDDNSNLIAPGEVKEVNMGDIGALYLNASVSSSSQNINPTVTIKIPEAAVKNAETLETYFIEFPGPSETGETIYIDNSNGSQIEYKLYNQDGQLYLSFDLEQGSSAQHTFGLRYPNGITTAPKSVTVAQSDITIDDTTIGQVPDGFINIYAGGTLSFVADFAWDNISIVKSEDSVSINSNKLSKDIIYRINNISQNRDGYGDIFSCNYTITEEITLPQYLSFSPEGEVECEPSGNHWKIKVGGTTIAEVYPKTPLSIDDNDISISVPVLSEDGKTLSFKLSYGKEYEENQNLTEESAAELPNPDYEVKLIGACIEAETAAIKNYYDEGGSALSIANSAVFEAVSVFGEKVESSADVETLIDDPQAAFSVEKDSNHPYIKPGETEIEYTIRIKNQSEFAISGKSFTVTDTLSEFVEYVAGSATFDGYTYDEESKEYEPLQETISDSCFDGGELNYTANMYIPKDGAVIIRFKVKVNKSKKLDNGTGISNIATVQTGNTIKKSNTVSDVYYTGTPTRNIKKSVHMLGGKSVISGHTAVYEIVFSNSSGLKMPFTIIDEIPKELNVDTIESAVVHYSKRDSFSNSVSGELKIETWTPGDEASPKNKTFSVTKKSDGAAVINFGTFKDVYSGNYPYIKITYNAIIDGGNESLEGKEIKNKVYINEEKSKSASATLLGEKEETYITIEKRRLTNPQHVTSDDIAGLYKIPYEVKLINKGCDYEYDDSKENYLIVTDIMSGGLMPEPLPKSTGTIHGTLKAGETENTVEGEYEYSSDKDIYTITWKINKLDYSNADPLHQTAVLSYDGYASSSTSLVELGNIAKIGSEYEATTLPVSVELEQDKIIYSINGVKTNGNNQRSAAIYSGDKVVYKLTVKNIGNMSAMGCTLVDIFPLAAQLAGEPYYSLYDETSNPDGNVRILSEKSKFRSGKSFRYDTVSAAERTHLKWTGVEIYAGDTLDIYIEIQYPKSAEFNERFVGKDLSIREGENIFKLSYDGYDTEGNASVVRHTFTKNELSISKTVNISQTLQSGDTATFTISGFGTNKPVEGYRVVDVLSEICSFTDVTEINTGAYSGISEYTVRITYDARNSVGNNIIKEFQYTGGDVGTAHTLSGGDLSLSGYPDAKIIQFEIIFGDVDSMTIVSDPTVTVKIMNSIGGSGNNQAKVYFDTGVASATARIKAIEGELLKKYAYNADGTLITDESSLREGDYVNFRVEVKNISKNPMTIGRSNPITDYMTVKGVAEGTYNVYGSLLDANGIDINSTADSVKVVSGLSEENYFTISSSDKNNASAKQIEFIYGGTIEPGYTLVIQYSVKLDGSFAGSQKDKNEGKDKNWIENGRENLTMFHNEALFNYGGEEISKETGFYYQLGENKLKIQKQVNGFTYLTHSNGDFSDVPDYIPAEDENGSKPNDLSLFQSKYYNYSSANSGRYTYDVVRYSVVIANEIGSGEDLTIQNIEENLPYKTVPAGITGKYSFQGKIKSVIFDDDNYKNQQFKPESTVTGYINGQIVRETTVEHNFSGTDAKYFAKITGNGYKFVNGTVKWNDSQKKFTVVGTDGKELTLKPGEAFAFTYGVPINRSGSDPEYWENKATLNIGETEREFNIANAIGIDAIPTTKNKNAARANGDCKKVSEASFSSAVKVYPENRSLGIKKTSTSIYSGSFDDTTTLEDIAGLTSEQLSSDKSVGFGDVVEWTIEAKTSGGNCTDVRITDKLPYPYKVITDTTKAYVMQRYDNSSGTWVNVPGTVVDNSGAGFGETSQTITVSGLTLTGTTSKFRILARYDGAGGKYFTRTYRNSVELNVMNGDEKGVISKVLDDLGSPKYNNSNEIIGITASDYIQTSARTQTESVKQITNKVGDTGSGDTPENDGNLVLTDSAGDEVTYTLNVTNSSSTNLNDFVIIDKLPQVGDTGSIDTFSQRESEFSVLFADNPDVSVSVGGITLDSSQYKVSYTVTANANDGFTTNDWSGTTTTDWTDSPEADSNVLRVDLTGITVGAGQTIKVEFKAKVGSDAQLGEIAWNSFGYAYNSINAQRIYAEPAKVGVKIKTTDINIIKEWHDGSGSSRPDNLTIKVTGKANVTEGEETEYRTVYENAFSDIDWNKDAAAQWTGTIAGLPATYNNEEITYTVEEVVSSGYIQIGSETIKSNNTVTTTFKNAAITEFSGTKTWLDGKVDHSDYTNNLIQLYKWVNGIKTRVNIEPEWTDVSVVNTDTKIKHVQKYEFKDLPMYDENGNFITYSVEEKKPDGYEFTRVGNNFVNMLLTSFKVQKIWKDNNNPDRPSEITLCLLEDGVQIDSITLDSSDATQGDDSIWEKENAFVNLPVYGEDGHKITYTIEEASKVAGYRSEPDASGDGTLKLTNVLSGTISISGQKKWIDQNNKYGTRPDKIALEIMKRIDDEDAEIYKEITVSSSDSWQFILNNLPKYNEDGREYTYSVNEKSDLGNYDSNVSPVEGSGDNKSVIITNQLKTPDSITVPLKVNKVLTGENAPALQSGQFGFEFAYTDPSGNNISSVVYNGLDSDYNVKENLTITEPGNYEIKISEVIPDGTDYTMKYDERVITARFSVSLAGGKLVATEPVYYDKDDVVIVNPTFTNTYIKKNPVSVPIEITKILNGRDTALQADEFSFVLTPVGGTPGSAVPAKNDADGKVDFGSITCEEPGTYYYRITEIAGTDTQIDYSDESIDVTVSVYPGSGDSLLYQRTYYKDNAEISTPTITNQYIASVSSPLEISKAIKNVVDGEYAPAVLDGQFAFRLYEEDGITPIGDEVLNDSDGKVTFPAIEYKAEGTYEYVIKETAIKIADTSMPDLSSDVITAKVTVGREGNSYIVTNTEYFLNGSSEPTSNPTITNDYHTPQAATASLTAHKSYIDGDIEGDNEITLSGNEFRFTLRPLTNEQGVTSPMPDEGTAEDDTKTVPNDANGSISFGDITFDKEGTYTYEIKEDIPTGADKNPSITYDEGTVTATVTVTKSNTENKLEAAVSYTYAPKDSTETTVGNTFTNEYTDPTAGSAELKVQKLLLGKNLAAEDFEFKLENTGAPEGVTTGATQTAKNSGDGYVTFNLTNYTAEGTYLYTISEVKPDTPNPSIEYSTEKVYAKVVVTKNSNNELVTAVTYSKTDPNVENGTTDIQAIKNTYVTPTAATVTVNKVITGEGAPALKANQFSFTLQETDKNGIPKGGYQTASNNESGKVSFTLPQYTAVGKYYYTVTENKSISQNAGISVSTEVIKVTVEVKRVGNELTAAVSYSLNGEDVTANPTITNTYTKPDGIPVTLAAKKILTGRKTALQTGEFSFTLTPQDGAPGKVQTKSNAGDGTVTFDSIVLSQAGTYTYTIAETTGTDPYITYDTNAATATVTVTFNEVTNTLSSSVSYSKGGSNGAAVPVFRNVYKEPEPVTAEIKAHKSYDKGLSGNDFSFTITPQDGAPQPAALTVKNAADGKISFGNITFDKEGTYVYEINENPLTTADANYDPSIKCDEGTVVATVNVVKSTTARELVATVTYKYVDKDNTETAGNNTFTNKYEAPGETSAALQVKKVLNGSGGSSENFTFELKEEGAETALKTKSGGAGTITFDSISYTEPGTYLYTITEKAGTNPSIEYSTETVYAKVKVTKNADNTLSTAIYYGKTAQDVEEAEVNKKVQTITNTYITPAAVQLQINKAMTGDSWELGAPILPGQYSFSLKETTGETDTTVGVPIYNGSTPQGYTGTVASEDVIFPSITYTKAGTYTYEISEVVGTKTGITYSSEIIKVTVVVEKEVENHELYVASVSYTDEGDNPLTDPTITNKYTKPGDIKTTLSAKKQLTGRALKAGEFSFNLLDKDGNKIDSVTNGQDGSIIFEDVSVTLGENIFRIKEVIPEVKDTSITYDPIEYYAVVTTALDETDGSKLKVTDTSYYTAYTDADNNTPITRDKPVFENIYTAPSSTAFALKAAKSLIDTADNSRKMIEDGQFNFALYTDADRTNMIGTPVSCDIDGNITFDEISISEAGTYTYYIGELKPAVGDADFDPSITYDETLYKAVVSVDKKDGTNDLEVKSVVYTKADGSSLEEGQVIPAFVNEYTKPTGTSVTLGALKSYNLPLAGNEFEFTLTPQRGANGRLAPASANADPDTKVETVGNGVSAPSGDNYVAGIEFSKIVFDEPGDYTYKIAETKGANSSISYDSELITANVHVYRHATENRLVAEVSYTKGSTSSEQKLTFVNEYSAPQEVKQTISLTKNFVDKDNNTVKFGENIFTFKIEGKNGAPMPDVTEISTNNSSISSQTLSFGEIKFTEDVGQEAKVYEYTLKEIIPADVASGKNPSVTYDGRVITAKITVSKGTEGADKNKLIASAPQYYDADGNPLTGGAVFTNVYSAPEKTEVTLQFNKIYKELVGAEERDRTLKDGDFSFTLAPQGDAPAPLDNVLTAENDAAGNISFGKIEFAEDLGSASKTYTYIVSENNGGYPSITYDDKPITVEITVKKDTDNKLKASVVYKKAGNVITAETGLGLYFKNVYEKPEPTTVNFDLTKVLKNADISKYSFDFTLTPQGDAPASQNADEATGIETVQNTATGEIHFSTITFDEDVDSKEYKYIITETKGSNPSIDYDENPVTVMVTVTKGMTGENRNKLITVVRYEKNGADVTAAPKFENTYNTPTPVTPDEKLKATKKYVLLNENGVNMPKAFGSNIFRFAIEAVTDGAPLPANTEITTTDANKTAEELFFGDITFTEDVGSAGKTYEYRIKEIIPVDRASGRNPSVTYDESVVTAKITVTKGTEGENKNKLMASAPEYYDASGNEITGGPVFTNTYKMPQSVNQTFRLTKQYTGKELLGDDFEFILKDSKGVTLQTVTNNADGTIIFTPIVFSEDVENIEKEYKYTIEEINKHYPSITYDEKVMNVTVKVRKTDDNKLVADTTYEKDGKDVTAAPSFSNIYTKPEPTSVVLEVGKEFKNGSKLKGGEFSFVLKDAEGNAVDTADNDENGRVVFDAIEYKEDVDDKTYSYTISEVVGDKSNVVYDKKVIDVEVRVVKSQQNKLVAEIKYLENGEETAEPKFENKYVPPIIGASASINAQKVYDKGILNGNDFKFKLEAAQGNPYKVTKYAYNDNLGNISFGSLDFYNEGEYKYTISEVIGDNKDIRYDEGKVNVTVKVTKNQIGTLEATVEYERDGKPDATFTNEYLDPDSVAVNIFAKKILKGKALEGNEFSFMLQPVGGTEGETYSVRNAADGTISFREITFKEEGVYKYKITELQTSKLKNITYDSEPVYVTVTVTRNEDGRLEAAVAYTKNGGEGNTFVNIYKDEDKDNDGLPPNKDSDGLSPFGKDNNPKTGDTRDLTGHMIVLALSSTGLVILRLTGKRKKEEE